MASFRQSELFAGQDWTVLYRAFQTVNFNASDPPSIYRALREYLQSNYPEDFDDWIESSEFVAIIELLAWLAGTLAFRTDIAARENFLETAEARESILRLARFLSYNPSRTRPARGVVKLVEVQTDDDLYDGFGQSLSNVAVRWDDADDADWFERFVTVLNAAFEVNSPYGTPTKTGSISGANAHLYRLNNRISESALGFAATTAGLSTDFEVVNADFDEDGGLFERTPNPNAAMHLYYLNDGNGNTSRRTGFFLYFKQGTTQRKTYQIDVPIENMTLDIDGSNVTQDDIWVQSVDDNDNVLVNWTKVPVLASENITYTAVNRTDRNIYSVITRDEDRITLRFSDGRFGNAPSGRLRVTYRIGNGRAYQIKPLDIDRVQVPVIYYNRQGIRKRLTLTFSLYESVFNATARETEEEIRRRAPLVYAAQNRMVSGEDYNTFPLSTNLATRIKAVNRVYSGHSRFTNLHDPTGTYADVDVFAEDGILFSEQSNVYGEVPLTLNRTPRQMIDLHIQPMLVRPTVRHAMRSAFLIKGVFMPDNVWSRATSSNFNSTGNFVLRSPLLRTGAAIRFDQPDGTTRWATVTGLTGSPDDMTPAGQPGPVTLSEPIPTASVGSMVAPRFVPGLSSAVAGQIEAKIETRTSFSLWYDYMTPDAHWSVREAAQAPGDAAFFGTSLRVMTVNYVGGLWRMTARGSRFVFESLRAVEWYSEGGNVVDSRSGEKKHDVIRVLGVNENLHDAGGHALRRPYTFSVGDLWYYPDGSAEPRRVIVDLVDEDEDGVVDEPDAFLRVISPVASHSRLFWQRRDGSETMMTDMLSFETVGHRDSSLAATGSVAYVEADGTFWTKTSGGWDVPNASYRATLGRGPNVALGRIGNAGLTVPKGDHILFNWKHYATSDHRIDPAATNVHDIFVLSSEYDTQVRTWIRNNAVASDKPVPPTELDLRLAFADLEKSAMFSDSIVWRPVRYKYLFGPGAVDELQAQIKVVKLPNSPMSDGEIRSRVVRAINEFFDASLWDFGQTFYYMELGAYIQTSLAGVIASAVLVPQDAEGSFGDGFEVPARPDELFISSAQVSNIQIISSNTNTNLRIR